jgi:hypothetical protein
LGFDIVSKTGIELRVKGLDPIYLCHCPEDGPIGMKVFHGHTHEKTVTQYHFDEERDLSLYYNICLDYNKKIISLQEILEKNT